MEKYKVTQQFMDALVEWRDERSLDAASNPDGSFINGNDVLHFYHIVWAWWSEDANSVERNKRLIAIIRYLNGKDVFEVVGPHKFVVRSTKADVDGAYRWMYLLKSNHSLDVPVYNSLNVYKAKRFDTRMEAELWTTNGYEVVEIDGGGNEVTE